jgi:hypothetical protein
MYSESAEIMVPHANPDQVEGDNQDYKKLTHGFIKLVPKLTERKVIADTFFELKNRSVGYLSAEDIDSHFKSQPGFESSGSSVEYLLIRRNKEPEHNKGIVT